MLKEIQNSGDFTVMYGLKVGTTIGLILCKKEFGVPPNSGYIIVPNICVTKQLQFHVNFSLIELGSTNERACKQRAKVVTRLW